MHQLKITAIGNSAGIILPKELLARLGVEKGDSIELHDDGQGGLRIVKSGDAYAAAMAAGLDCFERYPQTMADLAK
ncbi:AbrB/MazE/SpoVT family DNA-binding domain-containing protein [Sandarakinorhabdus sp.]|uniref:AbrB/MazE/SpoVT family DNA-binding domain-containing protein n=1 Tax=Sandarakinorhabdus sp. TaxID=1916663 RepID=UPI003F6F4DB7